jgi:hypothetical protein
VSEAAVACPRWWNDRPRACRMSTPVLSRQLTTTRRESRVHRHRTLVFILVVLLIIYFVRRYDLPLPSELRGAVMGEVRTDATLLSKRRARRKSRGPGDGNRSLRAKKADKAKAKAKKTAPNAGRPPR